MLLFPLYQQHKGLAHECYMQIIENAMPLKKICDEWLKCWYERYLSKKAFILNDIAEKGIQVF